MGNRIINIIRNPLTIAGGALGAAFLWGGNLMDALGLAQWLAKTENQNWIINLPGEPEFGWLWSFAALGLIALGAWRANKTEDVVTQERKTALEIPILMAKAYCIGMELSRFKVGIAKAEAYLADYKSEMERWLADAPITLPAGHTGMHSLVLQSTELQGIYRNLGITIPEMPCRHHVSLVTDPHPTPNTGAEIYLKSNNGPVVASIQKYIREWEQYVRDLHTLADAKEAELRGFEAEINVKVANYG